MSKKITFAILAYNEEKRLPLVIKNLRDYGDIVILDGGSTDRTKEIAESMGAKWFSRPEKTKPYVESKENFDFIYSIAETKYIYWGYTDNIIPKKTLEFMAKTASEEKYKWVYAPLNTYLWGNTTNHAHKSYIPVLYDKDYVDFSNERIHSMGDYTGKKEDLVYIPNKPDYALQHFSVYDMRKFVMGHLKYAEVEAQQKFDRGEKFGLLKMFAAMFRYMYIYGKYSYKNGTLGILIILHYAFFRMMAYTKLYELEHGIMLTKIENDYEIAKEEILKDF